MKFYFLHLLAIPLLLTVFSTTTRADTSRVPKMPPQPQEASGKETVQFMSFNIRYGTANDGLNVWPLRQQMVSDLIRREMPDFLGTQEMQPAQSKYLQEKLPEYAVLQRGRNAKPHRRSEMCGLFYRKDRWKLDPEDHGTFWLSATPDVPGSKGPEASHPRVVTWGRFLEKDPLTKKETGRALYVYNTHFDHRSSEARKLSATLIAQRMASRKEETIPAIMMGDLNADEPSEPIRYLLGKITTDQPPLRLIDPFRVLHPEETTVGTFNGFKPDATKGAKIDYLFTTSDLKPLEAEILRDSDQDRYPSDHFPVTLKVRFP